MKAKQLVFFFVFPIHLFISWNLLFGALIPDVKKYFHWCTTLIDKDHSAKLMTCCRSLIPPSNGAEGLRVSPGPALREHHAGYVLGDGPALVCRCYSTLHLARHKLKSGVWVFSTWGAAQVPRHLRAACHRVHDLLAYGLFCVHDQCTPGAFKMCVVKATLFLMSHLFLTDANMMEFLTPTSSSSPTELYPCCNCLKLPATPNPRLPKQLCIGMFSPQFNTTLGEHLWFGKI